MSIPAATVAAGAAGRPGAAWMRWGAALLGVLFVYVWYTLLREANHPTPPLSVSHTLPLPLRQQQQQRGRAFPVWHGDQLPKVTTTRTPYIPPNITFSKSMRRSFLKTLKEVADKNNTLVLSVIDVGFIDIAVNFMQLSLKKVGIENYLFVCVDAGASLVMHDLGYNYFDFSSSINSTHLKGHASDFGSEEYFFKTNLKTFIMLQALQLGFTVLLSDVDIAYFKNPFPYFNCSHCDIHIQMDRELYNSGFVYGRPTKATALAYQNAWHNYLKFHRTFDQAYINSALEALKKNNSINIRELSRRTFVCGVYYFENDFRSFSNKPNCDKCIMAHNNYVGSTAAKVYRFKENLMWFIDRDGYYSSPDRQYLIYENPVDIGGATAELERRALIGAFIVGFVLNRTAILPTFRCCNCRVATCDLPRHRCSLMSVLNVKKLDDSLATRYREHTFLSHPKVPNTVFKSQSPVIVIERNISQQLIEIPELEKGGRNAFDFTAILTAKNPVQSFVGKLKEYSQYSVVRFKSLYSVFDLFTIQNLHLYNFGEQVSDALRCDLYPQWDEKVENKILGNINKKNSNP